jgi:NAD(P)-dependent dehydrogenase (short-subunit alcohol dehydrogenase family)
MTDRLRGRRSFITGGASGLGAGVAHLYAEEGASVAIADLPSQAERGSAVVEAIEAAGGRAFFVPVNVLDAASVNDAVATAIEALGGIDNCVLSAGVSAHPKQEGSFNTLLNLDPEHFDFVMEVNTRGVFLCAQAIARHMVASGIPGSIITIASTAAKRPTAGVYSVSKAAVWMLTRCLAQELAPHNIRANAIGPSYVETELFGDIVERAAGPDASDQQRWRDGRVSQLPLGRFGTPRDIAEAALFLASDASTWFTGSILHPDGGYVSSLAGG